MSSWIGEIGELLAGLGAAYAAVMGIASYRQSVRDRRLQTLIELERDFKAVFDIFSKIDDDVYYDQHMALSVEKILADKTITAQEQLQIHDLDLCFRFFYLLWVRTKLFSDQTGIYRIYTYYLHLVLSRDALRRYAEKYYPILRELDHTLQDDQ